MRSLLAVVAIVLTGSQISWGTDDIGNVKSPQAVREVLAGKRAVANAAWWGFDEEDSTDAIQGAINSGASRLRERPSAITTSRTRTNTAIRTTPCSTWLLRFSAP